MKRDGKGEEKGHGSSVAAATKESRSKKAFVERAGRASHQYDPSLTLGREEGKGELFSVAEGGKTKKALSVFDWGFEWG